MNRLSYSRSQIGATVRAVWAHHT